MTSFIQIFVSYLLAKSCVSAFKKSFESQSSFVDSNVFVTHNYQSNNIHYIEFKKSNMSAFNKPCYSTLRGYTDTGENCEQLYVVRHINKCDIGHTDYFHMFWLYSIIFLYFACTCSLIKINNNSNKNT